MRVFYRAGVMSFEARFEEGMAAKAANTQKNASLGLRLTVETENVLFVYG